MVRLASTRVGEAIEQDEQVMLDARRVLAVRAEKSGQRLRAERPPDEVDDSDLAHQPGTAPINGSPVERAVVVSSVSRMNSLQVPWSAGRLRAGGSGRRPPT